MRAPAAFGALRHPRYRRVWWGNLVTQSGNWMQITGRAVLIYEITGSTTALGLVYFLAFSPQLFLSQFAGVVADRFDRRRLLMGAQAASLVGALVMGVLAATGTATLANVGALSVVLGVVQLVQMTNQQALVPALVPREDLGQAVALTAATQAATRVFGPLLAAGVAAIAPLSWLFWGNALTFAVILVVWTTVHVERQPPMAVTGTFRAIAEGISFARHSKPILVALLTTFVIAGIGNIYQPMGVVYATDVLAGGDNELGTTYYGVLQASLGTGAFLGILGLTSLARRRPALSIVLSSTGFALGLIGLGLVDRPALAIPMAVVVGACHFSTSTTNLTIVQMAAPDEMRGRLVALHQLGFVGMLPLISLLGGWLSAVFGIQSALVMVGAVCLVYCAPLTRLARHLPAEEIRADEATTPIAIEDEVPPADLRSGQPGV